MQFNSKEGFILTTALVAVTVLVTILLHNKVNNAIERRAKSLTCNELKTFGNIIEQNKNKTPTRQESIPIESVASGSKPISVIPEIPKTSPSPPPVGSGKKWTPL